MLTLKKRRAGTQGLALSVIGPGRAGMTGFYREADESEVIGSAA
jgi:hypothetical protein